MRFVKEFDVSASPDQALNYIADFANLMKWDESVTDVVYDDDQEFGVGAKYRVSLMFAGKPNTMDYRVMQYSAGEFAELKGENAASVAVDRITVKSKSTGCRVTYEADIRLHGWIGWLDPILALAFAPTVNKAVKNMRNNLDQL